MWRAHLISARIDSDFYRLSENLISDRGVLVNLAGLPNELVHQQALALNYLFCDGGNVVVGESGNVTTLLGGAHPFARERHSDGRIGRPTPYICGYVAPHGTRIPDLSVLSLAVKADVEEFLKRAHDGERNIRITRVFETARKRGSPWSKSASVFERKALEEIHLFVDGQRQPSRSVGKASPHVASREAETADVGPRRDARSVDICGTVGRLWQRLKKTVPVPGSGDPTPVVEFYIEGLSHEEIAARTGRTLDEVKVILRKM